MSGACTIISTEPSQSHWVDEMNAKADDIKAHGEDWKRVKTAADNTCPTCQGEMTPIGDGTFGCQRCAEQSPKHLCDTCRFSFVTCPATGIIFGIDKDPSARGAAADVVVECDTHQVKG